MKCEKCGEDNLSKLVKYTLKFSKPAIFCAKCALKDIPLAKTSIKGQQNVRTALDGPRFMD